MSSSVGTLAAGLEAPSLASPPFDDPVLLLDSDEDLPPPAAIRLVDVGGCCGWGCSIDSPGVCFDASPPIEAPFLPAGGFLPCTGGCFPPPDFIQGRMLRENVEDNTLSV